MTVFSKDTVFQGNLTYSLPLKIQGQFKGKIVTQGYLWIDKEAVVEAEIITGTLKLEGKLTGNIIAYSKVELLSNSKLFGNIKTTKLDMSDNVVFEGHCEMLSEENNNFKSEI